MLDKELLKKQANERRQKYYSTRSHISGMKYHLQDLESHRGNSSAFKLLMIALDTYDRQVLDDYRRYEMRIGRIDIKDEVKEMQTILNRERLKREELEKQIKEATTSSGLFIKYVRKALKV
jgi:hypothetical protein|tara:strand:+ start:381 stop:743 length:363 start_codon:yes stop_codon:yes gene_type:complete